MQRVYAYTYWPTGSGRFGNSDGSLSRFLPFLATWMIGLQEVPSSTPTTVILVAISLLTALGGFIGERLRVKDETVVRAG